MGTLISKERERNLKNTVAKATSDAMATAIVSNFIDNCKSIKNITGIGYEYRPRLNGASFQITLTFLDGEKKKKQIINANWHQEIEVTPI